MLNSDFKIGVITVAFNEPNLITGCVRQFERYGFRHVLLISEKPWRGDYAPDNTAGIAQKLADANKNIISIFGYWPTQAHQFNYGLERLSWCDWVLIVDADEYYTKDDVELLVASMDTSADAIRCPNMQVYWKNLDYRIIPQQTDSPVVAVRPHVRFTDKRSVNVQASGTNATLHHLSYVRTDEEMLKKINSFEHSHEFDLMNWYEEKWLRWKLDSTNLHPVVPSQFARAIYNPSPVEICGLYYD